MMVFKINLEYDGALYAQRWSLLSLIPETKSR